jgi:secreted trypsin-like serine protease
MVLTAAHCAGYTSYVELGRSDQALPYDESRNERIEVSYEITHPQWDPSTVDADYMILKLARSSTYFGLMRVNSDINLPNMDGEVMTIMGFGDTNPDPEANVPSSKLLEVTLEYVTDEICRSKGGEADGMNVDYSSRITGNMM